MPRKDPEERKAYWKTPAGRKVLILARWKHAGIILDDRDAFYERYMNTWICEECGATMTDTGMSRTCRVPHHDHAITDRHNVIAIICQACNTTHQSTNTSGEPNIGYYKQNKNWRFKKEVNGTHYSKGGFSTFEEAMAYKTAWMRDVYPELI